MLYNGGTTDQAVVSAGVTLISGFLPDSTGDVIADYFVEVTFGLGADLVFAGTQMIVSSTNTSYVNQHAVSAGIFSMLSVGSGGGHAFTHIFTDDGGGNLWFRL